MSVYMENQFVELMIELEGWLDQYSGVSPGLTVMNEIVDETRAWIDAHPDTAGIIDRYGIKCDRELNPDPSSLQFQLVITATLVDGHEPNGASFTISDSPCIAKWCERYPDSIIGALAPVFDPIAAYNRAMSIIESR